MRINGLNFDIKGNIIKGDYVLTPCRNAFNNNTTYWISRRDCVKVFYCFTYQNDDDFWRHIDCFDEYIEMFDKMFKK